MATLSFELYNSESYDFQADSYPADRTTGVTTKTNYISCNIPEKVEGQLCKVYVHDFRVYRSEGSGAIYRLEVNWPQPYGTHIASGVSNQNTILAYNFHGTPFVASNRPILLTMPQTRAATKFTLSCLTNDAAAGYWAASTMRINDVIPIEGTYSGDTGYFKFYPTAYADFILEVVPVKSKDHHEDLVSYSTGPFIRM